ncbi:MAG: heme exporter protein CcmD [Alphaproteobacteria bacterium]|nr:heme exporter protein CcmD [Alphaproteobacteria bacterium]
MTTFLSMGGYAAFVWPAFGIATLTLALLWIVSARAQKAAEAALDTLPPLPGRAARARMAPKGKAPDAKAASPGAAR